MIKSQGSAVYQPQNDPSGFDGHSGSVGAVNGITKRVFSSPSKLSSFSSSSHLYALAAFVRAKSEHIRLMLQDVSAGSVEEKTQEERDD